MKWLHVALFAAALCALPASIVSLPRPAGAQAPLPPALLYDFGMRQVDQDWLSRDDPARLMPYRAEGVIAVPPGPGPFPAIFVLHAALGGCPTDESAPEGPSERWPCAPQEQQRNDIGMTYLVRALAARGYVAVAPNLNAAYANAYGAFGPELRRFPSMFASLLQGLAAANAADTGAIDASVQGKLDLSRIGLVGHGHGALLAMQAARPDQVDAAAPQALPRPLIGALLVAPLYSIAGDVDAPLAVVLPSCDGIAPDLNGQGYYEDARLNPGRAGFAASIYLIGANHGFFNELVRTDDAAGLPIGAGCSRPEAKSARAAQRDFLAALAPDFFGAAGGDSEVAATLGLDPAVRPPTELYGQKVQIAAMAPWAERAVVVQPASGEDLGYNGFGGYSTVGGPASVEYCAARVPCGRWPIQPGNPSQARLAWTTPVSARWTLPLSEEGINAAEFVALHLRAAIDPTDYLNAHRKPIRLRLTLADAAGREASVLVDDASPALSYPIGSVDLRAWGWAGHAFLTSVRVPIRDFRGIDLGRVTSLELSPSGDLSGALIIADVEFLRGDR